MTELNNIYSDRDAIFKARETNLDQQRKSLKRLLDTIDDRQNKLYAEKKELNELKKELEIKERMLNDGIKEEKISREEFNQKVTDFNKEKAIFDKEHTLELEKLHNESLSLELLKNEYEDKISVLNLIIKKDKNGNFDQDIMDIIFGGCTQKDEVEKELNEKLEYLEEYKFKLEKVNDGLQEKITCLTDDNKRLSESLDNKSQELKTISEDAGKAITENTNLIKELEELRNTSDAQMKELKAQIDELEENKEVLMQKIVDLSSSKEEVDKEDVPNFGTEENVDNTVEDVPDFGTEVLEESKEVLEEDDFEEIEEQVQEKSYAEETKNFIEKNYLDFENVVLKKEGLNEILSFSAKDININIFFSDTPKFELSVKRDNGRRLKKLLKMKTDASKGKVSYRYENGYVYATSYFAPNTEVPLLVNNIRIVRQEFV